MSVLSSSSSARIAFSFYKSLKDSCQCCKPKKGYRVACKNGGLHSAEDVTKTKNYDIIEEYILAQLEEHTTEFMEEWEITLLKLIEEDAEEDADYIRACENGDY